MAIDVKRQRDLRPYYFLPARTSLKRSRCYMADDVDASVADLRKQLNGLYEMNAEEFAKHHRQVSDLRDCIKAADSAGLKAPDERNEAEKKARDLQMQLDECQALLKRLSAQKTGWHPYRGCGDAPKVKKHQTETCLCMVQRYAKDTGEEIGAVRYQVLLCDGNGMFWGLKRDSWMVSKVIAWREITGRDYEDAALAYQRQGTAKQSYRIFGYYEKQKRTQTRRQAGKHA